MDPINRRSVIITTVAGCAGMIAGCLGDRPRYEEDDDLSIDANDYDLDDDWIEETGEDANPNWEQTFFSEDDSRGLLYDYEIHEEVNDAEDRYEQSVSDAGDIEEWDVADQSYIFEDDDIARVFWRDSNAIFQLGAVTLPGGADRQRATRYGRAIHDSMNE